MINDLKGY